MESAKIASPVALADERVGAGWRRPRKFIRIVAVMSSLVAAAVLYGLFNQIRAGNGEAKPERQLIASVDLRIGNPIVAGERGEAKARADVEAGVLELQTFGLPLTKADAAKAQRLKQRHGITWVHKADVATPVSQAYADGYNRVMWAEIERRHGAELAHRLMRELKMEPAGQDVKEAP